MLAVILTGGKSSRMGRDKAMLPVAGVPMARLLASRFRDAGFSVAFSVDRAGRFPLGDERELPDAFPGEGPLNGLYSAFTQTAEDAVFFTATDLPGGDPALAKRLIELLDGHDACLIRRADGRAETLFGVYARSCLPAAERCLREGRRAMRAAIEGLRVRWVDEAELPEWELARVLRNVNTPEEYAALEKD